MRAIPWGFAIAGIGAVAGGVIGAKGAKDAAKTQAASADKAINSEMAMYNQTRNDLMPYNTAGQNALTQYQSYLQNPTNAFAQLQQFPGYQFQYDQGMMGLNRNLAAGGRFTSGAMMKDAQSFGQGMAQSAVTQYLGMLQYLGTMGQNSAAQTGAFGTQVGNNVANSQMAQGSALASGQMGASNAIQGGLQNALTAYNMQNGMSGMNSMANYNTTSGNWTPGPGGF